MTLDPLLLELRAGLRPFRRRLWLRRIVRDGTRILAAVAIALLSVAFAARVVALDMVPAIVAAVLVAALVVLLLDAVRLRPTLAETALALDGEQALRDRISSALELAAQRPDLAGPMSPTDARPTTPDEQLAAMVRLQREDAARTLAATDRGAFRPRVPRRAAAIAVVAILLVVPAVVLPNPQSAVLAQRDRQRDAAEQEARHLEDTARRLEQGATTPDARTQTAEELRRLARELRDRPQDLDAQLARLGSLEDAIRSRLDPRTEQRAAAISTLSRSLSRAATGSDSNPSGDPQKAADDAARMGEQLPQMTPEQRAALARQLGELDDVARQAGTDAQSALHDAAGAIANGDLSGAQSALSRLGQALTTGATDVQRNRDLASAAGDLQTARRTLTAAAGQGDRQAGQSGSGQQGQGQTGDGQTGNGQQGNGQQGNGQQGQGQGSQGQGQNGSGQQGNGNGGQSTGQQGQGNGQGQGQGSGQGQGQGQGTGQGAGQGQGQGSQGGGTLGGGGSNARYLGSGRGGTSGFRGPTNPNKAFGTDKVDTVFADFARLGKPGDPTYVAGSGGKGQTSQGNGQGQGTDNGSVVPYTSVLQDFSDFAIDALDRTYVPIDVKDYVRDYFASLGGGR